MNKTRFGRTLFNNKSYKTCRLRGAANAARTTPARRKPPSARKLGHRKKADLICDDALRRCFYGICQPAGNKGLRGQLVPRGPAPAQKIALGPALGLQALPEPAGHITRCSPQHASSTPTHPRQLPACCSPPTPHFSDSTRAPRPTRAPAAQRSAWRQDPLKEEEEARSAEGGGGGYTSASP